MAKKKAKIKTKPKKKETYYVSLRNGIEIRQSILDSTKEFVQVIKMYENYIKLKGEITHKVEKLQKDIKKIRNLNSKLKRILPETNIRIHAFKKKKKVQKKEKKTKKTKTKKPNSEIDQIEQELNMIESKLSKIQ